MDLTKEDIYNIRNLRTIVKEIVQESEARLSKEISQNRDLIISTSQQLSHEIDGVKLELKGMRTELDGVYDILRVMPAYFEEKITETSDTKSTK